MKLQIRFDCKPLPQILIQMNTQSEDLCLQVDSSLPGHHCHLATERNERLIQLEVMMRPG